MLGDVNEILSDGDASFNGNKSDISLSKRRSGSKPCKGATATIVKRKRPVGMSAETYKLLNAGIMAAQDSEEIIKSTMPTRLSGYKSLKAQIGITKPHKYLWREFVNQARSDDLKLCHWVREDRLNEEYRYAKWNRVLEMEMYTEEEYAKQFARKGWTKEQTDLLFDLCTRFDLRWPVIHDRFNSNGDPKRNMEDLKDRYYSIANCLKMNKNVPVNEMYNYDAEHERIRKEMDEKLWGRTAEQRSEEQELLEQLRLIEVKKKQRVQKAHELQKLMDSLKEPESPTFATPTSAIAPRLPRKYMRSKSLKSTLNFTFMPEPAKFTKESVTRYFRIPQFRTSGSHLRTEEYIQLKTRTGTRDKNIVAVLGEAGLLYPMGLERIVTVVNDIKKNVVILQELKESLAAAEYELNFLRSKFHNKPVAIPSMIKANALPLLIGEYGGEDQPSTPRRFTALISNR